MSVTRVPLAEVALGFARAGFAVFPLLPGSKNPATRNGFLSATSDPEKVAGWWARNPGFNIGIATAGLIVIDCDAAKPWNSEVWGEQPTGVHNGDDVLAMVAEQSGDIYGSHLAHSWVSATRSDGRHYWFTAPEGQTFRNRTARWPWVDVRASGGYIIAPWSVVEGRGYWPIHLPWVISGDRLVIEGRPPLPPQWIVDALAEKPRPVIDPWLALEQRLDRGTGAGYAAAALRGEIDRVRSTYEGSRNHVLNRAAFSLGQLVTEGQLGETEVADALLEAAIAIGLSDFEARQTIRSGLRSGQANPRGLPA